MKDGITVSEAAKIIGVGPEAVRRYCRTGKLKGEMFGGTWMIERRHAENFKKPLPGNPAGKR